MKRGSEDTAQSLGQRIQDALAAAKTSASETASSLRDHASGAASQLATGAHGVGDEIAQGRNSAQAMGSNVLATIADNPMLLGAIGLAVGALLGALVPQSEQEESALAGMAGQARKTAQNLGQEVMDRSGRVAHQVLDAGRDSARAHGLTADKSVGEVVAGLQSGDFGPGPAGARDDRSSGTIGPTRPEARRGNDFDRSVHRDEGCDWCRCGGVAWLLRTGLLLPSELFVNGASAQWTDVAKPGAPITGC